MEDFNVFSGALALDKETRDIHTRTREILRLSKMLGIELHSEFNLPLSANTADASRMIGEVAPDLNSDHMSKAAHAVLKGEDPIPHLLNYAAQTFLDGLQQHVVTERAHLAAEAINTHGAGIVEQLEDKVFEPTIKKLAKLIDKHPGKTWNIDTAVKQADYQHAAIIKEHQHLTNDLSTACVLRGMLYNRTAFTNDAAWITEPAARGLGAIEPHKFQWWMRLVEEGHPLYFPTAQEWYRVDQENGFAEQRAKAQAEKEAKEVIVTNIQATL